VVLESLRLSDNSTLGKDQFQNWDSREGPECDLDLVTETRYDMCDILHPKKGSFTIKENSVLQTSALKIVLEYEDSSEQHNKIYIYRYRISKSACRNDIMDEGEGA